MFVLLIRFHLKVTREEVGGDNGGKGGRAFRNNYKGHMDKIKVGWNQGREVEKAGMGTVGGGGRQTTVLEQQ